MRVVSGPPTEGENPNWKGSREGWVGCRRHRDVILKTRIESMIRPRRGRRVMGLWSRGEGSDDFGMKIKVESLRKSRD